MDGTTVTFFAQQSFSSAPLCIRIDVFTMIFNRIASTFTYPLQVIKSRLQQRSEAVNINQDGRVTIRKRSYKGPIDCVRRIWYNEGILGFWKGCIPNAVRVAPSAAITFVTYEFVLSELS